MGKRNISQLRKPTRDHDVTRPSAPLLSGFHFETKAKASEEDRKRRKAIKRVANWPSEARRGLKKGKLRSLRESIKRRMSAASSRYMRKHRRRIINAVYELASSSREDLIMVNLVSPSLKFSAGKLSEAHNKKILERLRQVLLRYGSSSCEGWLIAFIDGEFEESDGEFVIHFHGLATRDYDEVLQKARKESRLLRRVGLTAAADVRTPVRVVRKLTNLPRLIGYCVMAYWPARNRGLVSGNGQPKERRKRRVKEPHHSEYLLWLDRYKIQDLCLMIGLEVDRDGCLKPTR